MAKCDLETQIASTKHDEYVHSFNNIREQEIITNTATIIIIIITSKQRRKTNEKKHTNFLTYSIGTRKITYISFN